MRRIVSAVGPALALVVSTVPATVLAGASAAPAAAAAHTAKHGAKHSTALDTASSALGASYVHVSWNWIKAASGYRIQVAKRQDFGKVVVARKKTNSRHRPAGGREAAVVGKLHDATYYWVRVRKVKHHHKSRWSAPVRVATRAHVPDKVRDGHGGLGPRAGSTTLHWKGTGKYTDFFKITTSLTPFGTSKTPAVGSHSMTFTVPGDRHSLTLSPQQTAAAGAGLGAGRHLFFRIVAFRRGEADSASRRYPFLLHTVVRGQHSTGDGPQLRYAAYSMRVATKDVTGHPWKKRQHLIARNIAKAHPAVAALEELMPAMWTNKMGGVGLRKSLREAGAGRYDITRHTAYFKSAPQDTKILYDTHRLQLVSNCPEDVPSCYISIPSPKGQKVAAWAKFRDRKTGRQFYFVSAHLETGNNPSTDAVRGRQVAAIDAGIRRVDDEHLPVVFACDSNSSQTAKGKDLAHQVLLDDGWYNTLSAAKVVNGQYNSVNHYQRPQRPSNYGFGSMYDTIMTLGMPGADLWKQVITKGPFPSDHNLVYADVRLP
jgi:endonuclease/exonuclease/phosphatase family metal-dependent hydrolase